MEELIRQRVKEIISSNKNVSLTSLGGSDSVKMQLSRQINGTTTITVGTILLILEKFPQVSAEWLLRGEGSMYRQENEPLTLPNGGSAHGDGAMNHSNSDEIIRKFIDEIAAQRQITQSVIEHNGTLLQMLSTSGAGGAK